MILVTSGDLRLQALQIPWLGKTGQGLYNDLQYWFPILILNHLGRAPPMHLTRACEVN